MSSLGDVLATLELERVDQWLFVGQQLPAPANHILGGHISAQALLAASHTSPGRAPHSVHTYFLRPLVAYLSAVTLTEPAYAARGGVGASAQARPFGLVPRLRVAVGLASL